MRSGEAVKETRRILHAMPVFEGFAEIQDRWHRCPGNAQLKGRQSSRRTKTELLLGLRIPAKHWLYLIGASILFFPIVANPLAFLVLLFLIRVCRVPIAVQTGAGYVPHPVFDHWLFFDSVFLAVYFSLVGLVYLMIRLGTSPAKPPAKDPRSELDD